MHRSGPFLSHSSISKGNSLRPALHHFLCTGKFLVQTGSYVPRHCCHTLLRYRFYSTKPSHALQESSLKYFKWKWIPKDTWPNYAIGVRRRKKLEGAGWRLFLEFLGSLDYMKKDLGRDKSKLKHLHRKQGSEATSISWTLPRTKQQHVFQNKWKKVFFPWRRELFHRLEIRPHWSSACKNNGFSWHFKTAQFNNSMFHLTFKKSSVSKKLIGKSSRFQELANTSCMRTELQESKTLFKKSKPKMGWGSQLLPTLSWTAT